MAKYFVPKESDGDWVGGKAYSIDSDGYFVDENERLNTARSVVEGNYGSIVDLPEPDVDLSPICCDTSEKLDLTTVSSIDQFVGYLTLSPAETNCDELVIRINPNDQIEQSFALASLCGFIHRLNDYQPVIESELPVFPNVPEQAFPGLLGGQWGG